MADTLESLEIQVRHSATGAANEIRAVASAIRSVGNALEQTLPSLREFNNALGRGRLSVTTNNTQQVANTINNVTNAASRASSATTGMASGMKRLSKEASKAKSPLETIISSFKRIAFYRIIRAIIKEITQAFAEGLKNAYAFSQGITGEGHRFSTAMDSMSSAGLKMKNQLGSAFIGLLAAIQPVVNQIISLITKLADALSRIFALFTGKTYLKAADVPKQWGEAASGAGKAAKEWKNQLMGFDEINRLDEPSGGGGGGGGSALDPSSMFEEAEANFDFGWFQKYIDATKKWLSDLDFGPLMRSWERLKGVMLDFAEILDDAVYWAYTNVLLPLGKWVIETAAPLSVEFLASVLDVLNAVLERLGPVFVWIYNNCILPLAQLINTYVVPAIQSLNEHLGKIAQKIREADSFEDFISSLNKVEFCITLVVAALAIAGIAFLAISHPIATAITLITLAIGWIVGKWEEIKAYFMEYIEKWKGEGSEASNSVGLYIVLGLFEGMWNAIKNVGMWIWTHIGKPIVDAMKSFFGIHSPSTVMEEIGGQIIAGLQLGIVKAFTSLWTSLTEMWENIKTTVVTKWQEIVDSLYKKIEEFKTNFAEIIGGIKETFQGWQDKASEVVSAISGFFSGLWSDISSFALPIIQVIGSIVATIGGLVFDLGTLASSAWDSISSFANAVYSWGQNIVDNLGVVLQSILNVIQGLNDLANQNAARIEADGSIYLQGFASGGFPGEGELFISRESGPEMVGTIGNRTAVANNDQIVQAVSAGVASAVASVLGGGSGNSNQPIKIFLDGKEIARTTTRYQNQFARAGAK